MTLFRVHYTVLQAHSKSPSLFTIELWVDFVSFYGAAYVLFLSVQIRGNLMKNGLGKR
jgi:hypothetical protein